MSYLIKGRYTARIALSEQDILQAQALRCKAFAAEHHTPLDQDDFDDICTHFLIEMENTRQVVGCFRVLPLPSGAQTIRSYSAQFYELSRLQRYDGKMLEMGRFCVLPGMNDPDILRVAWGAMTRYVDENEVKMLFGCSSFQGIDTGFYLDTFALLKDRYLAPPRWLPRVKSPLVFRFAEIPQSRNADAILAMQRMPPLLKSYLMMGGWVSDHAVVDRQMNTLHVFTGLEISAIPPVRKRLLRRLAQ